MTNMRLLIYLFKWLTKDNLVENRVKDSTSINVS